MKIENGVLIEIEESDIIDGCFVAKNVSAISSHVYKGTIPLKSLEISSSVRQINEYAFEGCQIEEIIFNDGLETIKDWAFHNCKNLKSIVFPSTLDSIGAYAFYKCRNLNSLVLPKNITNISHEAFGYCSNLKRIEIPSSIKYLQSIFSYCKNLKEVILNEGLEKIEHNTFLNLKKLKNLNIPSSVKSFSIDFLSISSCIENITIYTTTKLIGHLNFNYKTNINITNIHTNETIFLSSDNYYQFYDNGLDPQIVLEYNLEDSNLLNIYKGLWKTNRNDDIIHFFDANNNWVSSKVLDIIKYDTQNALPLKMINRLYEWVKRKKFLPNPYIIMNMPLSLIDNFYINNNCKRWRNLLKEANIDSNIEIGAFFKLCFSLGLFDISSKVSMNSYTFIKEKIIPTIEVGTYHIRFGEMNIYKHGYNKEFKDLFFKYFDDKFLIIEDENNVITDYISSVYNNFETIKKAYPNKLVNTNTKKDMLTPKMCMDTLAFKEYDNVLENNEQFAAGLARYGYSQEDFEYAQELFEIAKSIPKEEITLHIANDNLNNELTYELLEKNNPLGVILGNITNCCQTLNGAARTSVKYGLTKRNSKFLVFKLHNTIIGQSWVWYDEITKKICLDSIEIPSSVLSSKLSKKEFQVNFIKCLHRCVNGFIKEMEKNNLEVSSITIGEGYNQIKMLLQENFKREVHSPILSEYNGYSDASNQFILYKK